MANKYLDLTGLTSFLDKLKMHFNKRYCEGFKKIPTTERNFTRANWDLYGTIGRTEPWSNVTSGHGFAVGDYAVITGKVSDENDIYGNPKRASIYGLVTATTDTVITMKTSYLKIEDTYHPGYKGNARVFSGVCSTAAGTAIKEVTCPDFTSSDLVTGAVIFVTFTATNTAAVANLNLNVNGTGNKRLYQLINTTYGNLSSAGQLRQNQTYCFHYDGSAWTTIFNYNNTYSSMSQTEATTGTATNARSISAKVLYDTITGRLADYMESDNLDISSGNDAIQIYYNGNNYSTYEAQAVDTLLGEKADKASFYQASPSSAKSCSAGTLNQVNLSSTDAVSSGSGISISANGIAVTTAGMYRVTAAYSCSGMAASISKVSFTIRKGISFPDSTMVHQLTLSTPGNSSTWTSVFNVSSKIVSAKAGDIFFLGANFTGGAGTVAAGTDTFLLVERII